MASFRRTMSLVPRDATEQFGEAVLDPSPSPKPCYPRNYLAFGRLLATLSSSLDSLIALDRIRAAAPGLFLQRASRHLERPKLRGQHWNRAFFHFSVCFMVGIFVGFTQFISVDFSKNSSSKHQAFSFEVDPVAENAQMHIDMPKSRALSVDESALKDNTGVGLMSNLALKNLPPNNFDSQSLIHDSDLIYRKLLVIVTPTYARPFQAYYLNRLGHTLRNVQPPILWIVVEMSSQSTETAAILRETGVMYRHLVCVKNLTATKDRGANQRNVALSHIKKHHLDGIVYFADDDNIYSYDIFEQMREIRRFGTWPVAMLTENKKQVLVEGPVCNGSQVIGWHTNERRAMSQRFHAVMSGFAFNSTILWDRKRWHRSTVESILFRQLDTVRKGFQATTFIEQLVEDESQMECLPKDHTMLMVWHLNVEAPELFYPQSWSVQKNLEVVAPLA